MEKKTFRDIKKTSKEAANIIITGLAFDENTSIGKGASFAPAHLRLLTKSIPGVTKDAKLLDRVKLFDNGDFTRLENESIKAFFSRVEKETLSLFSAHQFNIFIGGDHSVNIPLVSAFLNYAQAKGKIPVYIHLDAHPDLMDVYLDNPLSHATPVRRHLERGLKEENLVMVGLRGFEAEEVDFFAKHPQVLLYTATGVKTKGIKAIGEEIKAKFSDDKYVIYFSYDIDANDPSFAPGTGTPEAFGLSSDETLYFALEMSKLHNTIAMDIVEISPPLDQNDITSWLALKTLYEVIYEKTRNL